MDTKRESIKHCNFCDEISNSRMKPEYSAKVVADGVVKNQAIQLQNLISFSSGEFASKHNTMRLAGLQGNKIELS